ncbi:MAG: GNAT family N-acetyltransferase [Xanthomonadales bacterium]|jgi:predicted N-acyltransferase|nr:GNAT family N-acetyltransferase [Xanthomonadales bacterium]
MNQPIVEEAETTVRWLDRINEVSAAHWDALFAGGNPFLRHAFLSSLEDSGSADAESGWRPRHLVLERQGIPVAAMPLYLKAHSYGEFVFDWGWAEAWSRHGLAYYPKLLTAIPFCPSVGPRVGVRPGADKEEVFGELWSALSSEIDGQNLSSWHLLFADASTRSPWLGLDEAPLLERQDVQFHFLNPGFGHFDDFLASLRSKRRKNVRKERRRVAAQDVQLERQVGSRITEADWNAFYRCYVSTFLKRSGHGGYLTREFFTLLRERLPDQLMLVVARRDDRVIAGALFLFDEERLYGRWWGALGHVDCLHFETCFYQGIEFAIERKLAVFDPGTQGEHKLLRGFEPVTTRSLHYIRDPRFRAAIADFLDRERDHVEAYGENAAELLPFRKDQPPGG